MAKFESMQSVFRSNLKPRARLVLQCLVLHCNQAGECFPSIKTIAAECGYGVSTVKRALGELLEAGYIQKEARFDERKNGGQTSNLYTLRAVQPEPSAPKPEEAPVGAAVPSNAGEAAGQDAIAEASAHSTPRETCAPVLYSFDQSMSRIGAGSPGPSVNVNRGAVHFYPPLNRTVEQFCTGEEKSIGADTFLQVPAPIRLDLSG